MSTNGRGSGSPTFSWSYSRDYVFHRCARQYYFSYYGYWGGWREGANAHTREIWRLRSLTNRWLWVGSMVHGSIETILKAQQAGTPVEGDAHIEGTVEAMRVFWTRDFGVARASGSGASEGGFIEREYDEPVPRAEWARREEHFRESVRGFLASETYQTIRATNSRLWEIEESSRFDVQGVTTWAVPDLLTFETDGRAHLYDWKTGRPGTDRPEEYAVYALYVARKFGLPGEAISATIFHPREDVAFTSAFSAGLLLLAETEVLESARAMRSRLRDAEQNLAVEEDFEKSPGRAACPGCEFRRVCWPEGPA